MHDTLQPAYKYAEYLSFVRICLLFHKKVAHAYAHEFAYQCLCQRFHSPARCYTDTEHRRLRALTTQSYKMKDQLQFVNREQLHPGPWSLRQSHQDFVHTGKTAAACCTVNGFYTVLVVQVQHLLFGKACAIQPLMLKIHELSITCLAQHSYLMESSRKINTDST